MTTPPKSSEKRIVYEGKFLRFCQQGHWEFAERTNTGSAVIIIARTPEDKLLFVEQFRIPLGVNSIEMPAGLVGDIDANDTLELAAKRELLEETGWQAESVEVLMTGPTSSGLSNELIAFVRATNLTRINAGGGDDTENIIVHEIPVSEVAKWLSQKMTEGYAMDPKLWAGLWLLDKNPDGTAV
jgi:ADP-ribose pyrophosphatase